MSHPPADRSPRRLKSLRPADVETIIAEDPRLIVPVGTCEQHGPHLPVGCDTIIVEHLADDMSATFGVLRAPTVEYGVNGDTERSFAGNTSMRKKTLHRVLNDLLDTWECGGIREFILLTAHRHDPHLEALATVVTKTARVRVVDILALPFTDLLEGQHTAMHGDEVDTSLMLHLAPELVRQELAVDFVPPGAAGERYRRGRFRVPEGSSGSIGRPSLASATKGAALYDRIRSLVAERVFAIPPEGDDE